MPGEHVVYRTQIHWAVFLPALAWFIFASFLLLTRNGIAAAVGGFVLVLLVFSVRYNGAHGTGQF